METIFQRDLIAAARTPGFRWLRWAASMLALLLLWTLTRNAVGPSREMGRMIFGRMQWTLAFFLLGAGAWLGAPLLLRERQEGTLSLLFLTGLRPWQIVVGKAAGGFLRLLGVWSVTIPASVVPMVLGGVRILDVVESLLGDMAMMITGLIAGLMASAVVRHPPLLLRTTVGMTAMLAVMFLTWVASSGLLLSSGRTIISQMLPSVFVLVWVVAVTVIGLWMITLALQRSLHEAEAPRAGGTDSTLDAEQIEETHRRDYWRRGPGARIRGRHPLLWLRRRAPGQSPSAWIWVGLVLIGWMGFVVTERVWVGEMVGWLLGALVCFRAVRGYRDEIRNGAMELLLTTPLSERAFLRMPTREVLAEFAGPILLHLLIGGWMTHIAAGSTGFRWERLAWVGLAPWTGTWIALWVSSWVRQGIGALLISAGLCLLPVAVGTLPDWPWPAWMGWMTCAGFLGIGAWAHYVCVQDFHSRDFVLRQMTGRAGAASAMRGGE